ncbi:MAG: tetratricopeptide repeat protein [Pseudomonadota bacterium]
MNSEPSGTSALSSRELEIACAYCEGATYRDVAEALSIAPSTVRTHLQTIYRKLGVSSKIQLARVLNGGYATGGSNGGREVLPLPDKPSIAVLPFDNLNDDPEQDFFADGIVEDVITALSRFRSLFVIARNSSFAYKGEAVVIAQIARELGVRYVVEGSVRKAGDQLRITAQLIDASSSNHLWADRFDGNLHDVFDLQDQITEQIVVAVEPEIGLRERQLARRKSPGNLGAWELLQRGLSHFYRATANDRSEAIRLFREAIELDPEFATAHAYLSYASWGLRYADQMGEFFSSALASAEQAVALDPDDQMARYALGRLYLFNGETESGIAEMQAAIATNPNFDRGYHGLGWAYYFGFGQAEKALPHFDSALRLNPRSPMHWSTLMLKGTALRFLGRHDEAVAHCRRACQFPGVGFLPYIHLTAALGAAGQKAAAQTALEKVTQHQPSFSISFVRNLWANQHEAPLKSFCDGLRKAGVRD